MSGLPHLHAPEYDCIIIGAGIAGIAATECLRRSTSRPLKILTLEARGRIGGRIFTENLDGFPVDLGASWIRGIERNPLASLPVRLEGLEKVVIFDQHNRALSPSTSRKLVDRVWAARSRLVDAALRCPDPATLSQQQQSASYPAARPPSSLLASGSMRPQRTLQEQPLLSSSPTSGLKRMSVCSVDESGMHLEQSSGGNPGGGGSRKRNRIWRRQSWLERRRLRMEEGGGDEGDAMAADSHYSHTTSVSDVRSRSSVVAPRLADATDLSEIHEEDSGGDMDLTDGGRVSSPVPVADNGDISVRDWLLDEDDLMKDLNSDETHRSLLMDLVNIFENFEAGELDSVGLSHFNRREFEGPYLYVADGMAELVDATAASILAESHELLRLNHIVSNIDYSGDPTVEPHSVRVHTDHGTFKARCVIVTVPLGVLKHSHQSMFTPQLPEHTRGAIDRLGFGLIDKVVLEFSEPFWPLDLDAFWTFMPALRRGMDFDEGEDSPGLCGFVNMERMHAVETGAGRVSGPPCLVAYVSQQYAHRIEEMDDGEVAELFVQLLTSCFQSISELVSIRVTRWELDPFSKGACTYIPVGTSSAADILDLGVPIPFQTAMASLTVPHKAVYFAGEHCSRHHFATVHGALMSGWSVAEAVIKDIGL